MGTKPGGQASGTELRPPSHGEVARIVRQAELMRAEHIAWLFRSLGRGVARLARALVASTVPTRPARGAAGEP